MTGGLPATFILVAALIMQLLRLAPASAVAGRSGGSPARYTDFNGDGYSDLVISVSQEGVQPRNSPGALGVLHGSSGGLQAKDPNDQLWFQGLDGLKGDRQDSQFGLSLAAGDFNGDGYTDAAAGDPYQEANGEDKAGAWQVIYGSAGGLQADAPDDQLWTRDSPGVEGDPKLQDLAGYGLSSGDFNGDGFDDLGVYAPNAGLGGEVQVLYGSPLGLQADSPDDQIWSQDSPGVEGVAEFDDRFGTSLAAGDLNGDGFEDLAVGVSGDSVGGEDYAGAVNVLYGSPLGLQAFSPEDQYWSQDSEGVRDKANASDYFGEAVAIADLNGDGFADLAVGVPLETEPEGENWAGGVNVLYGSAAGLTAVGDQFWSQNTEGVEDESEYFDRFGAVLRGADFNGDGYADLAVTARDEAINGFTAGAVNVLYGSADGLQTIAPEDQFWHLVVSGVKGTATPGGRYGWALAAGDYNADGRADLAVGDYLYDLGSPDNPDMVSNAGVVSILFGTDEGLQAMSPEDELWHQDRKGVLETAEPDDHFGYRLA
jgi:hypothetical protein